MDAAFRSLLHFNRADAEALRELRDRLKVNLARTPDDVIQAQLAAWGKTRSAPTPSWSRRSAARR